MSERLAFDDYVLDLTRGCLLREGREVTLRPKTFAVLRYLVEHMGELVSKETLLAAGVAQSHRHRRHAGAEHR
jgi:DNA-binding winged helix-turn-helix (wHTH) protein